MNLITAEDYGKLNFEETNVNTVTIGPEFADFVVKNKNPKNRNLSQRKMKPILHCMETGKFQFNGESIVFDSNGDLLDGQHRLASVAQSGKVFKFVVATGLPPEAQTTIDTGSGRSLSDTFLMEGVKYNTICASVVNAIIQVEDSFGKKGFASANNINNSVKLDIFKYIEGSSNSSIVDSSRFASTYKKKLKNYGLSPKISATIHYMISRSYDSSIADTFFEEVVNGTSKSPLSGTALIRDRLLNALRNPNIRFKNAFYYAILIKGFNLWVEGKEAKRVMFNPEKEKFPNIVSYEKIMK